MQPVFEHHSTVASAALAVKEAMQIYKDRPDYPQLDILGMKLFALFPSNHILFTQGMQDTSDKTNLIMSNMTSS